MLIEQSGVMLIARQSWTFMEISGSPTNCAAGKFGVIGMANIWAREYGQSGIWFNAVRPGMVETDIIKGIPDKVMLAITDRIPAGRRCRPEEVANAHAFLASEDASFIYGATIGVSGGRTV